MQLCIVCALSRNFVIGRNNQLPWHLPQELAHFKRVTLGKPVIMGRNTFASIGKPLPKRRNIVLSTQSTLSIPGTEVFQTLSSALNACKHEPEVMIIGGANVYQQAIELADRLILTVVDCEIDGDAFFPSWDDNHWEEVWQQHYAADSLHQYGFCIKTLQRK